MKRLMLGAVALTIAAPAAAQTTIYSNDFQSGSTAGFSGVTTITTAPNGTEKFLGQLAAGSSAIFTVDTSGYTAATLAFDLYTINSLDGNQSPGPDYFRVLINGSEVFNYTFSNNTGWTQSYGGANVAGGTGSDPALTGVLGYNYYGPDHTYHLNFALGTGVNTVQFFGNSDQGIDDEGFGIDNILVRGTAITSGVPEPTTWAMMILGMGGIGYSLRRRRATVAFA